MLSAGWRQRENRASSHVGARVETVRYAVTPLRIRLCTPPRFGCYAVATFGAAVPPFGLVGVVSMRWSGWEELLQAR